MNTSMLVFCIYFQLSLQSFSPPPGSYTQAEISTKALTIIYSILFIRYFYNNINQNLFAHILNNIHLSTSINKTLSISSYRKMHFLKYIWIIRSLCLSLQ